MCTKPLQGLIHLRTKPLGNRLQVVVSESEDSFAVPSSEDRNYSRFCGPVKIIRRKNKACVQACFWFEHSEAGLGQCQRCDVLADAFDPGIAPTQKEGHVGAQRQPDAFEFRQ